MITQPKHFYCDEAPKTSVKTYDLVREGSKVIYKERTDDLNKGLSFTDFSVQSLLDADAVDLLQPVAPISRDNLSVADIANAAANSIGSIADNVNVEPSKTDEK